MYYLREIERKDIEIINKWRNDPEIIKSLGAPFRYINYDVDNNWFDNYMKQRNSSVRCVIVDENSNLPIGLISIVDINYINGSAELHIMIGDKNMHGKGAGTFAVKEIINHAFNNLNLRRIELGVLSTNSIAQKLYKKCGFEIEGIKKKAIYKNGEFIDLIMMAVLKELED